MRILLAALPWLILAHPLVAQQGYPLRQRAERRLEMMKFLRLTEVLHLSAEEGETLLPIIRRYENDRQNLSRRRAEITRRLREALDDGATDELPRLLDQTFQNEEAIFELNERRWQDLRQRMGDERFARYLLFERQFETQARRMIERARLRRGPGAQAPRRDRP